MATYQPREPGACVSPQERVGVSRAFGDLNGFLDEPFRFVEVTEIGQSQDELAAREDRGQNRKSQVVPGSLSDKLLINSCGETTAIPRNGWSTSRS